MIKCLFMIHRAPQLTFAEFADYWARIHSRMAVSTAPQLRMRRYAQNHRRDHEIAGLFQQGRGCIMGPFDGVAEAWWDSFDDMVTAAGETPEAVAAAILQDEARFVDLARSVIWFGEEIVFWPQSGSVGPVMSEEASE